MQAQDLTDEDIGRHFWVQSAAGGWIRILFEGFSRSPGGWKASGNGGSPYWIILQCGPPDGGSGIIHFRRPNGRTFSGVLVRASSEIHPVQIDWAVTAEGEIIELQERAG